MVVIARRFCGPPDTGNGGYSAGLLAQSLRGPIEVTLRKLRRDQVPLPFSAESETAPFPLSRLSARRARKLSNQRAVPRLTEADGVLHQILGDYTI